MKKKIFSLIMVIAMVVAMIPTMSTPVLAAAADTGVKFELADNTDGTYKLVFSAKTPTTIQILNLIFSYDKNIIQPVAVDDPSIEVDVDYLTDPGSEYGDSAPFLMLLRATGASSTAPFSFAPTLWVETTNRAAFAVTIFHTSGSRSAASNANYVDVFEFYFKFQSGCDENDIEASTFQFGDATDGGDTIFDLFFTNESNTRYGIQLVEFASLDPSENKEYHWGYEDKGTYPDDVEEVDNPYAPAGPVELTFTDSAAYDIPASTVGTAITSINVASGVSGGTTPYSFSAMGLPDGIAIAAITGVISGTPTEAAAAGTATITVTDAVSDTKSITIAYGAITVGFVAVTDITGVPATATLGTPLTLTGTVVPSGATNQTITWSVTSGAATISGNTLTATAAGTVNVRATIANGATASTNYTKDFPITVAAGPGAAVSGPPAVSGSPTNNSISVNPVTNAGTTGQAVEYAISTSEVATPTVWQAGTTFTGLTSGQTYYVFARTAANSGYGAGPAQWSAGITTAFTITVNNGTADKSYAAAGETITVTKNADPAGKVFDKWVTADGVVFDDETDDATTFDMPDPAKHVTVTATYKDITYAVTVNGGIASKAEAAAGAIVYITADPAGTDKMFDGWEVIAGAVTLANAGLPNTSFTMPAAPVEVTATYDDIDAGFFAVNVFNDGHGFAYADCVIAEEDDVVTLTANAYDGYDFDEWLVIDGAITLANALAHITTFDMPAGLVTVQATFAAKTLHDIDVNKGIADKVQTYEGDTVTITAGTPATGYAFNGWTIVSGDVTFADANAMTTTFDMPDEDVEVTANYILVTSTYTVTVVSSGAAGATGSGIYAPGATVEIFAGTRSNYTFNGWSASPAVVFASPNSTNTTFTMPGSNVTVTASWSGGGGGGGGSSAPASLNYSFAGGVSSFVLGSETGITVVVDHDFARFISASVNGRTLAKGLEYTVEEGSTRVTLLPAYLNTLSAGKYTMTATFNDGRLARADFTVVTEEEAAAQPVAPQPVTPEMPVNPFDDVNASDWFIDDVIFAYANGLMQGTSTEPMLFSPRANLTRGMVVTVLHNMSGNTNTDNLSNPFSDVDSNAWYANAVKWAVANNIVYGMGEGKFAPNQDISRQDLAVILGHYADFTRTTLPSTREYTGFADDSSIANYAKAAVTRLYSAEIVGGKDNNMFDPRGNATRAEFAAILHRYMSL